ncbi:MAG: tetratricopeptide repeat protein [Candidatus Hermodarchaeota archaeon]
MEKPRDINANNLEKFRIQCLDEFVQLLKSTIKEQMLLNELIEKVKISKEIKDLSDVVSTVIQASQKAREQENCPIAIDLLEKAINCLLPSFNSGLSSKDIVLLRIDLLKELSESFYCKGNLDKVVDVENELCTIYETINDFKRYIESKIKIGTLFLFKGQYTRSNDILYEALSLTDNLSEEEKQIILPELHRSLAISYRGYGDYKNALELFLSALNAFQHIKNSEGLLMTLWGIARLYNLRGEWEKSVEKYNFIFKKYLSPKSPKNKEKLLSHHLDLYLDLSEPLILSGEYEKAEEVLHKASDMVQRHPKIQNAGYRLHLQFTKLYISKKMFNEALDTIHKAQSSWRTSKEECCDISEMQLLELETEILIKLDEQDKARKKLEVIFPNLKNEWDIATWYLLLGNIEKKDLNLGSAQQAFEKAIAKAKEISHFQLILTCQIVYISLLIERARLGDQKAFEEATNQIEEIQTEVQTKSMPAMILETRILRANLFAAQKNHEIAYQILSEVEESARTMNLNRQRIVAQEILDSLEKDQFQFKEGVQRLNDFQVLKYLQDARRIVREGQ